MREQVGIAPGGAQGHGWRVAALSDSRDELSMSFVGEVTIGNVLTVLSVLVSAAALAYGWRKDRELQRREYADRVRRAAAVVTAKLGRWPTIALQFVDAVQPLALEVDRLVTLGEPDERARLDLLRAIYEQRAVVNRRLNDEDIESAYVELYGYDPQVHELFRVAVARLKLIDTRAFARIHALARGDADVRAGQGEGKQTLQEQLASLAQEYERDTDKVVDAFRSEMLTLIWASDAQILQRTVPLSAPTDVFPELS